MLEFKLLLLLLIANGIPVVASHLLGCNNRAIDGGRYWRDQQRLFGSQKTWGGALASLVLTPLIAAAFGMGWLFGLLFTSAVLLGDLLSSFVKRRLKMPPSTRCYGIDQLPESALPILTCYLFHPLTLAQGLVPLALFLLTAPLLSKLLFHWKIKNRPY